MPLTDNDLRSVLIDRSSTAPTTPDVQRLTAVQGRVRAIRQRRAAGAGGLAVLLVAALAVAPSLLDRPTQQSMEVPAHDQTVVGGLFPRFDSGRKFAAHTVFETDEAREKSFAFTPESLDFGFVLLCRPALPERYLLAFSVDGESFGAMSCNAGGGSMATYPVEQLTQARFRPGSPVTITVRVVAPKKDDPVSQQPTYTGPLPTMRVSLAVYTPVPRDQYPLPPRPPALESLDEVASGNAGLAPGRRLGTVDSRQLGANGNGSVVLELPRHGAEVIATSVAPGTLQIDVNGVAIENISTWTWHGSGVERLLSTENLAQHGVRVQPGDEVKVRVSASHFTVDDAWRVDLHEAVEPGGAPSAP